MKTIKVVALLFCMALSFAGYASTPKSEAYLQTPIGDGSESGFVMNAMLPDGTKREMHLFKTAKEMDSFTASIGFEHSKWHMKFEDSAFSILKSFSKKAKFDEDGYTSQAYSFDDIGEIGKVMKEKGLPCAIYAFKNGKEWRTVVVAVQDKKYSSFRFSITDYIDEDAYQARLAVQREEEEKRRAIASQNMMETMQKLEEQDQEWENTRRQAQADYQTKNKANTQQQAQKQQTNSRNSPGYHDKNMVALENYFNKMNVNKGGNALNRTTVTSAELARYEQLIESGVSSSAAAQQVYNEFRR